MVGAVVGAGVQAIAHSKCLIDENWDVKIDRSRLLKMILKIVVYESAKIRYLVIKLSMLFTSTIRRTS